MQPWLDRIVKISKKPEIVLQVGSTVILMGKTILEDRHFPYLPFLSFLNISFHQTYLQDVVVH